ncbi:MAG: Clp1/GlmU family protein [Archaeoglobaceae archaeon]
MVAGERSEKKVDADTTLLIEGDADLQLISGEAEVFGCPVTKAHIVKGKVTPFYFEEDSIIKLRGNSIPVKGSTIPDSWKELAREAYKKIFLFGSSDKGKSSLATYLLNKREDIEWAIDLDIGQSSVAHPCAMGVSRVEEKIISLSQAKMHDGYFTGSTSPTGNEMKCLRGVKRLNSLTAGEGAVIDTTGWTSGKRARDYKLTKLEILNPDVIICFEQVPYYLADYNVVPVEPFVMKKRSREVRKSIRESTYLQWLEGSHIKEFDCSLINNAALFKGEEADRHFLNELLEEEFLFAEKGYDFLNIYLNKDVDVGFELIKALKEIYNVEDVSIINPHQFKGVLAGLYGGKYLGMGVVEEVDIMKRTITVRAPVKEKITRIELGMLKLEDGTEGAANIPKRFYW